MANVLYEETSVQSIADAIRLKRDGSSDTYTIGQMDDGVLNLPMGNIPSYHREEAGRVVKKILELKSLYPNNIVFGTISDNHVDKTNASAMTSARHAVYALEAVGGMACDFVANLGDNVVGTNIDNDTDYANAVYMENASRYAMSNLTAYNLVGNHCKSNNTQKIYDLIGKYNSFDAYGTTQIRGFGYKDYPTKKVRVICLNTCDYWNGQGGNGMSYEQKDFFMKALDLSTKSEYEKWTIIVLSHIPLDFLGGDYNKGADLKSILKAYNDGSSVSIAVNSSYASAQNESSKYSGTLTYNYSGKNVPKVINVHGHIHTNAYGKLTFIDDNTELNIHRIATPNSSFSGNASTDRYTAYGNYSITASEANKIKKVANSKSDTSATFYFFDLDGQIVYAIGYGADIDRTVPYDDRQTYTVTLNLTNVTASNTSTFVFVDEVYNNTLTADAGYTLGTVTVTMGGVDITSSVCDGGVIKISEMDADRNTITGDIIITATAIEEAYIPSWDIANRTAVTDMYKGASATKALDRHHYYWGAYDTGAIFNVNIASCSVSGNDVTFTPTGDKTAGIGVPFHLEAGASYTFSATASVKARLRWSVLNADGTTTNSSAYSSSGTDLSVTFTAPADETMWVMLILGGYTADQEVTFTNITLTKDGTSEPEQPVVNVYSITRNLTNCTDGKSDTSITEGSEYTTTLSANSGYVMNTVSVKMGGVDVSESVVTMNSASATISIPNVTGIIIITATASEVVVEPTVYSITKNLTNCTINNGITSINKGVSYSATITPNSGYLFDGVTVLMGGYDITSAVFNNSNFSINIPAVAGDIIITASATLASGTPSYTNIIDTVGTEGNIRLRSGGNTASADAFASNHFPVKGGDIIRVSFPNGSRTSIPSNGMYCVLYGSDKSTVVATYDSGSSSTVVKNTSATGYEIHIPADIACSYARVAGAPAGAHTGWIVTVNEEIS